MYVGSPIFTPCFTRSSWSRGPSKRGDGESGEGGLEVSRYEGAVTLGVSQAGAEEDDALAFADGVEDAGRLGVRVCEDGGGVFVEGGVAESRVMGVGDAVAGEPVSDGGSAPDEAGGCGSESDVGDVVDTGELEPFEEGFSGESGVSALMDEVLGHAKSRFREFSRALPRRSKARNDGIGQPANWVAAWTRRPSRVSAWWIRRSSFAWNSSPNPSPGFRRRGIQVGRRTPHSARVADGWPGRSGRSSRCDRTRLPQWAASNSGAL